jgi:hypothetical protein
MKSNRIVLTSWDWTMDEAANNLDIPWPKIQKAVGEDHLRWLLNQPVDRCQLVLDTTGDRLKLVAEFFDQKTLTTYHLMWAK